LTTWFASLAESSRHPTRWHKNFQPLFANVSYYLPFPKTERRKRKQQRSALPTAQELRHADFGISPDSTTINEPARWCVLRQDIVTQAYLNTNRGVVDEIGELQKIANRQSDRRAGTLINSPFVNDMLREIPSSDKWMPYKRTTQKQSDKCSFFVSTERMLSGVRVTNFM